MGTSPPSFLRRLDPHMLRPAKMAIDSLMFGIESGRPMKLHKFVPIDLGESSGDSVGQVNDSENPETLSDDVTVP